jgi:hypothetical protein
MALRARALPRRRRRTRTPANASAIAAGASHATTLVYELALSARTWRSLSQVRRPVPTGLAGIGEW